MTRPFLRLPALLLLAGALGAPALAAPTDTRRAVPVALPQGDSPPQQDADMLALANELARQCAQAMEKWIAGNEVTEDRLFAFLYFPIANTDPTKFKTDWDRLADRDFLPLEEATLTRSAAIEYAVVSDRNGYVPTHNQRYSQPLTGNAAVDLVNNRTKRIFRDIVGVSAARNEAAYLLQRYQRDTGEVLKEISVPVLVRGTHFGAVRIGFRVADGR